LHVLARGGLVCASARALAEELPAAEARPEQVELGAGLEIGIEGLGEALALAGYERGERVDDRGQFAVRGGIVDVFPTTRLGPLLGVLADLVFQPDDVRRVWEEDGLLDPPSLAGATELDPFPQAQPFAFEAQRPAIAARGLAEAESELAALLRSGQRVVVAFPHRGEALRTQNLLRRVEARVLEPGDELPEEPELLFAVAPARRGFVWRELGLVLLPDHQVFRRRVPRERRLGGRALQSFADLRTGDYVVHEDHGVGRLLGFETNTVAGITRDYLLLAFRGEDRLYVPHEQLGKVSRYVGADASAPALSKLGG